MRPIAQLTPSTSQGCSQELQATQWHPAVSCGVPVDQGSDNEQVQLRSRRVVGPLAGCICDMVAWAAEVRVPAQPDQAAHELRREAGGNSSVQQRPCVHHWQRVKELHDNKRHFAFLVTHMQLLSGFWPVCHASRCCQVQHNEPSPLNAAP